MGKPHRAISLILGLALGTAAWTAPPWHASGQNTYGWPLMTPAERFEHQRRMRGFDELASCLAYEADHAARMNRRAEQLGVGLRPRPISGCEQLRRRGRFE